MFHKIKLKNIFLLLNRRYKYQNNGVRQKSPFLYLTRKWQAYAYSPGVLKLFWCRPKNLSEKSRDPEEFLRPSKCVITKLISSMFGLIAVFYTNFFFFSNLATLLEHLATLKRVATPSLRTAAIVYNVLSILDVYI